MRSDGKATKSRLGIGLGSALLALIALLIAAPDAAQARGGIGVTVYGGGGYYPYPYHPHYYYGPRYYYPPPYYYYPPPPPAVIYVPPPAPPPATTTTSVPTASQAQCREYESATTIDGRPQKVVGTACLQPDGSWRIIR